MTDKRAHHETLDRDDDGKAGSDRAFGFVFAAVLAAIGLWPLWGGGAVRTWAVIVGGAFLALAIVAPRSLGPANRAWSRFGRMLHRVVTPVILGLIFVTAVVPTGLVMRVMGKDPMRRGFDADAETYWIRRDPPGPAPDTMKNQF